MTWAMEKSSCPLQEQDKRMPKSPFLALHLLPLQTHTLHLNKMLSSIITFFTCGIVQPKMRKAKSKRGPSMEQRTGFDSPFARFDQRQVFAGAGIHVDVVKHAHSQPNKTHAKDLFAADLSSSPSVFPRSVDSTNKPTPRSTHFRAGMSAGCNSLVSNVPPELPNASSFCPSPSTPTLSLKSNSSPITASSGADAPSASHPILKSAPKDSTSMISSSPGSCTAPIKSDGFMTPIDPIDPINQQSAKAARSWKSRFVKPDGRLTREAILGLNIPKTGLMSPPPGSIYDCSSWNSDALSHGSYVPTVNSLDSMYCAYGLKRSDIRQYSQPCLNKCDGRYLLD